MDELPFDPTRFLVPLPVYACFLKGTEFEAEFPIERNRPDGRRYVAIFTDFDLASRFVAELKDKASTEIRSFHSLEAIADWLRWCEEAGFTHVSIDDDGKGGEGRLLISIPKLLRIVAERQKERRPTMNMPIEPEAPPLWIDERGDFRVGKTRILFDVLIDLHKQGKPPEYIAAGYPDLGLDDVYGVLAYYYRHQATADEYLRQRDEEAKVIRAKIEASQAPLSEDFKARMEAFKAKRELANAEHPV
jgi:uncharacterized protein (DUF433 family)